ncbi:NAD-dependent malic enzyme [uncultured archaeon]|nr:NAD-dependent malic enzyme [uncultured archaeon]
MSEVTEIIHDHPGLAWDYTQKGWTACVVSNQEATLGIGDQGASSAVIEGKAALIMSLGGVNCVPLSTDTYGMNDAEKTEFLAQFAARGSVGFGVVMFEDIPGRLSQPVVSRTRQILTELDKVRDGAAEVPVFHDDRDGTKGIVLTAAINSCRATGRALKDANVAIIGAGAAADGIHEILVAAGVPREHIIVCDSDGPLYAGREGIKGTYKEGMAIPTKARTVKQACDGRDVIISVAKVGALLPQDLEGAAKDFIYFGLENPSPAVLVKDARRMGAAVVVTGSGADKTPQANNMYVFPGTVRGCLEVRARNIEPKDYVNAAFDLAMLVNDEDIKRGVILPPLGPESTATIAAGIATSIMERDAARLDVEPIDIQERVRKDLERIQETAEREARRYKPS